jgi:hypothetical protein
MPAEVAAGQELSVAFEAIPDREGRREPLNLCLAIEPIESDMEPLTCASLKKGNGYCTRPAILRPGLYRLRLIKAHPAARDIERIEDSLVVYDARAMDR